MSGMKSRRKILLANTVAAACMLFLGATAVLGEDAKPAASGKDAAVCCAETCGATCGKCREECLKTLAYCLKKGGKHADPEHIQVLMDCIDFCDLSSKLTARNSPMAAKLCQLCTDVCARCAKSCEDLKDPNLQACVDLCKQCSQACCAPSK